MIKSILSSPTYKVLQSVRNGFPPSSLTISAATLAKLGRKNAKLPGSPK